LTISQDDPNGRHDARDPVRVTITEQGVVEIDAAVRSRDSSTFGNMTVMADDIASVLERCFAFAALLYSEIDPHGRHHRFLYGVTLLGMSYRKITRERPGKGPQSMSMRGDEPIAAFADARPLSREDLSSPNEEVERVVTLLERASRS
jgi:hypothetical protein